MCDVPSTAVFCRESIECFPGTAFKLFLKLLVTIPLAPIITGIIVHLWIPGERRKKGRPRKTWMEGVRAATKTRHLEEDQWLNRKEWCLGSGRRRQLSQDRKDR